MVSCTQLCADMPTPRPPKHYSKRAKKEPAKSKPAHIQTLLHLEKMLDVELSREKISFCIGRAFSLFHSGCRGFKAAWRKICCHKYALRKSRLEACESQISVCVGGCLRPEGLLIVFSSICRSVKVEWRKTLCSKKGLEACESQIGVCVWGCLLPEGLLIDFLPYAEVSYLRQAFAEFCRGRPGLGTIPGQPFLGASQRPGRASRTCSWGLPGLQGPPRHLASLFKEGAFQGLPNPRASQGPRASQRPPRGLPGASRLERPKKGVKKHFLSS